jgi:hypothetical protein
LVPLKLLSKPRKLPGSAWLPGLRKSIQRLPSTKPHRKSSTMNSASGKGGGGAGGDMVGVGREMRSPDMPPARPRRD